MEKSESISVLTFSETLNAQTSAVAFPQAVLGVVLQGNFSSNEDREEFVQTITSQGITFLRYANTPLLTSVEGKPNLLEKLVGVLSGLWAAADGWRSCNG